MTYSLMGHRGENGEPGFVVQISHDLLSDGTQRGQNGEPGLVVQITPPLTY